MLFPLLAHGTRPRSVPHSWRGDAPPDHRVENGRIVVRRGVSTPGTLTLCGASRRVLDWSGSGRSASSGGLQCRGLARASGSGLARASGHSLVTVWSRCGHGVT